MSTTAPPDLPAAQAGSGITYHRWTGLDDLPGMAAANALLRARWGEHEESDDDVREWVENPRFDIDLVTVVWHGDSPAACASSQVQEHADGGTIGYVDAVATHPDHRRLGLAGAALVDSLHRLAARGITRAYLGVDTDNQQRAHALYEEAGFRKASGSAAYRKPFDGQETGQ